MGGCEIGRMNSADFADAESTELKTSARWVEHFRANVYRDWNIPWNHPAHLAIESHRRIAASIAEFQRGESSEALHYLARSASFGASTGDPDFHSASILFVREENGHAALLLRFMRLVAIPQRTRVFSDGVFRRLRALSDLGWSSRVLLIAELIAQEYYPCLRAATEHPALRRICDKIICDEEAHIEFQVERIACLEAGRHRLSALRDLAQTLLMLGTAGVVFWGHRTVLESRHGPVSFVTAVLRRNRGAIEAMNERRARIKSIPVVMPVMCVRSEPQAQSEH